MKTMKSMKSKKNTKKLSKNRKLNKFTKKNLKKHTTNKKHTKKYGGGPLGWWAKRQEKRKQKKNLLQPSTTPMYNGLAMQQTPTNVLNGNIQYEAYNPHKRHNGNLYAVPSGDPVYDEPNNIYQGSSNSSYLSAGYSSLGERGGLSSTASEGYSSLSPSSTASEGYSSLGERVGLSSTASEGYSSLSPSSTASEGYSSLEKRVEPSSTVSEGYSSLKPSPNIYSSLRSDVKTSHMYELPSNDNLMYATPNQEINSINYTFNFKNKIKKILGIKKYVLTKIETIMNKIFIEKLYYYIYELSQLHNINNKKNINTLINLFNVDKNEIKNNLIFYELKLSVKLITENLIINNNEYIVLIKKILDKYINDDKLKKLFIDIFNINNDSNLPTGANMGPPRVYNNLGTNGLYENTAVIV